MNGPRQRPFHCPKPVPQPGCPKGQQPRSQQSLHHDPRQGLLNRHPPTPHARRLNLRQTAPDRLLSLLPSLQRRPPPSHPSLPPSKLLSPPLSFPRMRSLPLSFESLSLSRSVGPLPSALMSV